MMKTTAKSTQKSELRRLIRDRRRALSDEQRTCAAAGLLKQLCGLDDFMQSENVAMYLVNDGEIDPIDTMHWCWQNHRKPYVPIVVQKGSNCLLFAEIQETTEFVENRYGIREPVVAPDDLVEASDLDLVLMPLVAFDSFGNRVGMGGGFYDTTFEFLKNGEKQKPVLIGIAHEVQKVERIEAESWDIPLSRVVTDNRVYYMN